MPTLFENISDGFYTAFFEPDAEKRKAAIEAWIKDATPIIQSAVENDIRTYLELLLKDTWTPDGWENRVEKFNRMYGKYPFFDTYKLYLDIKLRQHDPREENIIVGGLSTETRANTLNAAKKALPSINPPEVTRTKSAPAITTVEDNDDTVDDDGGRSSNDDRSDSMNPNNDSYQASMDNHSNQMNPNNEAYGSSRGH
jgi:hypothetical protein